MLLFFYLLELSVYICCCWITNSSSSKNRKKINRVTQQPCSLPTEHALQALHIICLFEDNGFVCKSALISLCHCRSYLLKLQASPTLMRYTVPIWDLVLVLGPDVAVCTCISGDVHVVFLPVGCVWVCNVSGQFSRVSLLEQWVSITQSLYTRSGYCRPRVKGNAIASPACLPISYYFFFLLALDALRLHGSDELLK